jgi:hypothetical protein
MFHPTRGGVRGGRDQVFIINNNHMNTIFSNQLDIPV